MNTSYTTYDPDQIAKIGNTIVFLSNRLGALSKTRLLKLLYILDELSIKKTGIPFLNLKYQVWKFGPVANDLYVDFTSPPTILKNFIVREQVGTSEVINSKLTFCDDEFTQNDLDLIEFVVKEFGGKSSEELIEYTHRENSLWHITAKENGVLELLQKEEIGYTEFVIDMSRIVKFDEVKSAIYQDYIYSH